MDPAYDRATESALIDVGFYGASSSPVRPSGGEQDRDSPLLVIKAGSWTRLEVRELWEHRELFYFLAWRDLKIRYKQTLLGALWALLQPALTMVVFTILFGKLARVPSDGEPYAIFSYAGLLAWNFFAAAVTNSSNTLVNNTNLITKVYFPRLLIPTAAIAAALMDLGIASLLLLVIIPVYGIGFHLTLLMLVPLGGLTACSAAAVGTYISAVNVKYRDVRYALPFVIQLWMFLTPVIYPVTFLPRPWRWLLRLNPLSGIIEGFRAAVFASGFDWGKIALSAAITFVLLIASAVLFRRMEQNFADLM